MKKQVAYVRGKYNINNRCDKRFQTTMTLDFINQLSALAKANGTNRSKYLRTLVNEAYQEQFQM